MRIVKRRSFGIVPTAVEEEGALNFLILRSGESWDFPKGGADPGETPLAAAIREMKEETGIEGVTALLSEVSMSTEIYSSDKVASYFVARVRKQEIILPVSQKLGHPEHDEYRWVSGDEASTLLQARLLPILEWARRIAATYEAGVNTDDETTNNRSTSVGTSA